MTILFHIPEESGNFTYRLDGNTVSTSNGMYSAEFPPEMILGLFATGAWKMLDEVEFEEPAYEEITATDSSDDVVAPTEVGGAVASDGGSSSYYDLPVPDWFIERAIERAVTDGQGYIKTEELIEVIFQNDFDAGNAFKSLIRLWGAFNGAGKAGNSVSYDKRKIEYSLGKLEQRFERQGEAV